MALLRLLAQGRSLTVQELANQFGTYRQAIYRDLRALQDAGYPIAGDEEGRLSRPRLLSSPFAAIALAPDELEALLLATRQAQPALPNENSLSAAVLKLVAMRESSPKAIAPDFESMLETWNGGSKTYRQHEALIAVLIQAILLKRRCAVEYQAPVRLRPKRFDFDPYRLLLQGGGLYVIGYVPKHANVVTLAVDRLVSAAISQTAFEVDSSFDPVRCREDAFGVSWNDPINVVLRFRADQAPYVRERVWHPSQQTFNLPDGRVELRFRAGGAFEIRRWILGWGDAVEVVAPESLRLDVRQVWQSALASYQE